MQQCGVYGVENCSTPTVLHITLILTYTHTHIHDMILPRRRTYQREKQNPKCQKKGHKLEYSDGGKIIFANWPIATFP